MQIWISKYELTPICLDPPVIIHSVYHSFPYTANEIQSFKYNCACKHTRTHTHASQIQTGRRRLCKASSYQSQLKNSELSHNVDFLPWLGLDLKQRDPSVCRPDLRVLIEMNVRSQFLRLPGFMHPLWKTPCVTWPRRKIQEIPTASCAPLHSSAFWVRKLIRLSFTSISKQSGNVDDNQSTIKTNCIVLP